MAREAWQATVPGVTKNGTWLSKQTELIMQFGNAKAGGYRKFQIFITSMSGTNVVVWHVMKYYLVSRIWQGNKDAGLPSGSVVRNLPGMQEIRVWSPDQEDPLEESMTTHCIILQRIPWTEKPGGLQSMGSQRVGNGWSDWACRDRQTTNTLMLVIVKTK